jgi:cytochrome c556
MPKLITVVCALMGVVGFATISASVWAEDLATAVKERRYLMDEVVKPANKLGLDMLDGKVPFNGAKAAEAMNEIHDVPDKYVKLFPKGTEHGAIADSEALPAIWEDFDDFKSLASKLKDASAKAAAAAEEGEEAFTTAFDDMNKVCKQCHKSYRAEKKKN